MTLTTVITWLKMPALVGTGLGVVYGVLIALGFSITTPEQSQTILHEDLDNRIELIEERFTNQENLLESLTRHQCVEATRASLMLSGLITDCSRLGIDVEK